MQNFARDCVEEHYPEDLLPAWINKKEFYKYMTNLFIAKIKDALMDNDHQITVDAELAFPLTSAAIDSSADILKSYTNDLTIELPDDLRDDEDCDNNSEENCCNSDENCCDDNENEDIENEDIENDDIDNNENEEDADEENADNNEENVEDEEITFDDIVQKESSSNKCQYVFSRGKNAGQNCQTKPKNGGKFCSVHSK